MARLRRYLPPLLILLPLIFICGKLLLQSVELSDFSDPRFDSEGGFGRHVILRGWPWEFQAHEEVTTPPLYDLEEIYFSGWHLVADLAVLFVALFAAGLLLVIHYRRRKRWFSISLRELFAILTVVALVAGWWMHHVIGWRQERALLDQLTTYDIIDSYEKTYCGPQWIRRFVSDESLEHFFYSDALHVRALSSDKTWPILEKSIEQLPHIRRLILDEVPTRGVDWRLFRAIEELEFSTATDGSLVGIDCLHKLRVLTLGSCGITSDSLIHIANCAKLEKLRLNSTIISDDGLKAIARLPRLQELDVSLTSVTDVGVTHLASIRTLQILDLGATRATGDCLKALQKLPRLESLNLRYLAIEEQEVRQLLAFCNLESVKLPEHLPLSEETLKLLEAHIKYVYVGANAHYFQSR